MFFKKVKKEEPSFHFDYSSGKDDISEEIQAHSEWLAELDGNLPDLCCERFKDAVESKDIKFSYSEIEEIDETAWYVEGMWHLYFCPFCGKEIKGLGFGSYR